MATLNFRGFVCDEDSQHLASSFGNHESVVAPLSAIGITVGRGTPDAAIVRHAREAGRVVVTANESHFARLMVDSAQNCESASDCYCGGGMIAVPNGVPRFDFRRISREMAAGSPVVYWPDVFICNLRVDVRRDGSFTVKPLRVCQFFRRDHGDCPDCERLAPILYPSAT
jgi:hypothetical protein